MMYILIFHEFAQNMEGWTVNGTQNQKISVSFASKNYTIIHKIWNWMCNVGYLTEIPEKFLW